jgi:hypothetical protein
MAGGGAWSAAQGRQRMLGGKKILSENLHRRDS